MLGPMSTSNLVTFILVKAHHLCTLWALGLLLCYVKTPDMFSKAILETPSLF